MPRPSPTGIPSAGNVHEVARQVARTLDLTQPVAVILIAVPHFIPDADGPYQAVAG